MTIFTSVQKKKLWWLALTILLVKCSVIFSTPLMLQARETFEFNLGEKVNILSDKAFRKTKENEFEAVGNVVITHLKNAIYGEHAKLNFNNGNTEVEGAVRLISPGVTFYGTKMQYNFLTKETRLENARIHSDSFTIVGKSIYQNSPTVIIAEEAEYSTCKDCPESWSVYGKNIHVTLGKYVRIKHAFIKINGVITMYIPYLVFPIKQTRETGLLFPNLGYKTAEGFKYQQPFYWALSDYSDMTIVPSVYGMRGLGGEYQFRQNFGEKTWLNFNMQGIEDRIYAPYKLTMDQLGEKHFREFSDLEFHSSYKNYLNGHFSFSHTSDLDTIHDFTSYTNDKILGTEVGGGGFIDFRSSFFNLTIESYLNRNMLVSNPHLNDESYVQVLPKISLLTVPTSLLQTDYPFLKNISFGLNSDFTTFKQNKYSENGIIRNANRLNLNPYLDWQFGHFGPIRFSHLLKWDYQHYRFPYEVEKTFVKKGFIYQTEAKIELEKIWGMAYIEKGQNKTNNISFNSDPNLINDLPNPSQSQLVESSNIYHNSYRHVEEFKLLHYYLSDQSFSGNKNFYNQIASDNGQFDYIDALRAKEHISNQITAQDSLPFSNTIELQWNNGLIRKVSKMYDPFIDGRYLKNNFDYSNIYYFNVSQGLDLNIQAKTFFERLTRLYINSGINIDNFAITLQEFYFHRTAEHKLASTFGYNFGPSKLGGTFIYNSFNSSNTVPVKTIGFFDEIKLNDLFSIKNTFDYNIQTHLLARSMYSVIYSPLNDCWKLELSFSKDQIENKFGVIFYINYNEKNFAPINVH